MTEANIETRISTVLAKLKEGGFRYWNEVPWHFRDLDMDWTTLVLENDCNISPAESHDIAIEIRSMLKDR